MEDFPNFFPFSNDIIFPLWAILRVPCATRHTLRLFRALSFSFVIALVVSVVLGISQEDSFRGHSFRRGAASWAFNCDVPGELIQLYGDWSSDSYKLYLEFSLESKLVLATQLRSAIVSVA